MGLQLCLSEGGDLSAYDWNPIMQTILILSCFLAAASSLHLLHPLFLHPSSGYGLNQAHPGGGSSFQHVSRLHKREAEAAPEADADPYYGYYGHQLGWPTAVGYGVHSTVYGARPYVYGKRSAEAEAEPYGYGVYGHGFLAHGNTLVGPGGLSPAWPTTVGLGFQSTVYGARGKRSADADADAEADPHLGYYGLPLAAYHTGYPSWPGVRALGFSSTCWGCRGKRSAEPHGFPLLAAYHHAPLPLPFLHHLVPTATGEVTESGAGYEVNQTHGLHASSFQSVSRGAVEPAAEEEA